MNIEQQWALAAMVAWIEQGREFTPEQEQAYRAEMEFCEFTEFWTPSDSYERNLFDTLLEVDLPDEAWKVVNAAIDREGKKI